MTRWRPPPEVEGGDEPEPVVLEITDTLDLHDFAPAEVLDVLDAWLDAAAEEGFRELRIVHGRGKGVQRRRVHSFLGRDRRVEAFGDAPGDRGGWGATLVRLSEPADER